MAETYFTLGSFIVAKVIIDPAEVRGEGGPDYPRLVFRVKFIFTGLRGDDSVHARPAMPASDLLVLGFGARLCLRHQQIGIADSVASPCYHLIQAGTVDNYYQLEFPLDAFRIERMEQRRKGDMELQLKTQIVLATFGMPRWPAPDSKPGPPSISDMRVLASDLHITIPQSNWVKNVLSGLGYGVVQLLELPSVSLAACEALKASHEALVRAYEKFKLGDFDEAVGLCRTAVEPIRDELRKIKAGKPGLLSADWAEKIGVATVDWLTTVLGKTHGVANTPVHSAFIGHFSRLDAQMILHTSTAVIAFVARTRTGEG